jgi:hypothetical protein
LIQCLLLFGVVGRKTAQSVDVFEKAGAAEIDGGLAAFSRGQIQLDRVELFQNKMGVFDPSPVAILLKNPAVGKPADTGEKDGRRAKNESQLTFEINGTQRVSTRAARR